MSPERQRIVIAEACGWRIIHDSRRSEDGRAHQIPPGKTIEWFIQNGEPFIELPDFLNDLNAMAEAERTLTDEQYEIFALRLGPLTSNRRREYISASAGARAEAFIHGIGKWE